MCEGAVSEVGRDAMGGGFPPEESGTTSSPSSGLLPLSSFGSGSAGEVW